MKIASSTIAMQSERTYTAIRQEVREEKTQYITENDDKAENVKQPSIADAVKGMIEKQAELYGTANQGKVEPSYESEFSLKVKLMEKMLEALSKMVKGTGRKNPISLYD